MRIANSHGFRLFIRMLASVLALVLACSMPGGTFSALAEDNGDPPPVAYDGGVTVTDDDTPATDDDPGSGGSESGGSEPDNPAAEADIETEDGADSNPEPSKVEDQEPAEPAEDQEPSDPAKDQEPAEQPPEAEEQELEELPQSEEQEPAEQPEAESIELSDDFSQFVNGAILIGAKGSELIDSTVMAPDDPVKLRLSIEMDERILAAAGENGDAQYSVHIPAGLTAVTGEYGLKARGKLLGTLYVGEDEAYFVFNTDEDILFDEEAPEALNDLRLDIPCRLDEACADENAELVIDLSEYASGGTYIIRLARPLSVAPLVLPADLGDDFTPFVASAKLAANGSRTASELPNPYLMTETDKIYMLLTLNDLMGPDLVTGDTQDDLMLIRDRDIANGSPVKYKVVIPDMLIFAETFDHIDLTVNLGGYDCGDGPVLGTLHFVSGDEAYFTFNSDNMNFFDGDTSIVKNLFISFECELDQSKIGANDREVTVNMAPYDPGKNYTIALAGNIPENPQMYKSGEEKDGRYDWTVTIQAPDDPSKLNEQDYLYGPFTDSTGTNHALYTDVTVTGKLLKLADKSVVDSTAYTYKEGDESCPLTINETGGKPSGFAFSPPAGHVFIGNVEIKYSTMITGEAFLNGGSSNDTLKNHAEYKWGDNKTLTADADLSSVNIALTQKDGRFIPAERAIEWTVTVDTLGQDFSELILHDVMESPYKHLPNTVTVSYGNTTETPEGDKAPAFKDLDTPNTGSEMILPIIVKEDEGENAAVTKLYGDARIIKVTYKTLIGNEEDYVTGTNPAYPKNDAWLEYAWQGGPGYGPGADVTPPAVIKDPPASSSTPILKEFSSYNAATRTITWKITVNPNCLDLKDITVTDTVSDPDKHTNLKYHSGLSLNDEDIDETDPNRLILSLPDLNGTATFYVTSEVIDRDFLGSNTVGAYAFTNTAELKATAVIPEGEGTKDMPVSGTDTAIKPLSNNVLKKAAGGYDYDKHTVDWTITVNADKIDQFGDVAVTDTISKEQELVDSSGNVVAVSNDTNVSGCFTGLGGGSATATKNAETGETVVTINLGSLNGTAATIGYTTKYTDENLIKSTSINFKNTAELKSEYNKEPSVTVNKPVSGLVVLKKLSTSVVKADDSTMLVAYRVLIDQSQEHTAAFTLTDVITPSDSPTTVLVEETGETGVKLYAAAIDPATGAFQRGAEIPGITARFDGDQTLTVNVPAVSGACILEYDVIVRKTNGEKLMGTMGNRITSTHTNSNNTAAQTVSFGSASDSGGNLEKYIKVNITKNDEKTGSPVSGVEFGLYFKRNGDPDHKLLAAAKTGSDGKILFSLLMPSYVTAGDYFIREHPAAGYTGKITADGKTYAPGEYIQVTDVTEDNKIYYFHMTNERTAHEITFYKVAQQGAAWDYALLGGATFTLTENEENGKKWYGVNGNPALPQPAEGPDGTFTISNLKWGVYTLTETVPAGYVPHTCTYTLTVARPTTVDGNYESNDPVVSITKNNDGGSSPDLAVTSYNGTGNIAIVNEKGSISLVKVDPQLATADKAIISGTDGLENATFKLEKKGANDPDTAYAPVKLSPVTNKSGEYYVNEQSGSANAVPTANNGTLTFRGLDHSATYRVTEVTPPTGYTEDSLWSDTFTIDKNATIHHKGIEAENTRKDIYSFSFKKAVQEYNDAKAEPKTGSDATSTAGVSAAEFKLYKTNDASLNNPIATATISNGVVTFENIAYGEYYIVETAAPAGYALPIEKTMHVTLGRSTEGAGEAKVTITDRRTNTVIFNGTANETNLNASKPFINEKGTYIITKKDNLYSNTPNTSLAGAVFTATPDNAHISEGVRTVATNSSGAAKFEGLTVGVEYTFAEAAPPTGYVLGAPVWSDTFTPSATIRQGEGTVNTATTDGAETVYNNRAVNGSFTFKKADENGKGLGGATFELRFKNEPDGGQKNQLPDSWKTDRAYLYQTATSGTDGTVTFGYLPYGEYIATEITAPEGYRLETSPAKQITFVIAPNGSISVTSPAGWNGGNGNYNGNGTFNNYLGSFAVTKKDAADHNSPISDVKFELWYKDENDNNIWKRFDLNGNDTTGTNGKLEIGGLFLGVDYELREATAPAGYKTVDSDDYIPFKLTDETPAADGKSGYVQFGEYKNYRDPIYSFGFEKQDFPRNQPLNGAEFKIYIDSDCTQELKGFDANGAPVTDANDDTTGKTDYTAESGIGKNGQTSGADGEVWFTGLAFGTYYVGEYSVPEPSDSLDRYGKSDVVLKAVIEKDGTYSIFHVSGTGNAGDISGASSDVASGSLGGLTVKNELLGSLTITKQDSDNGNVTMSGAGFTLYKKNSDGTKGSATSEGQKTTDENGSVTFYGLTTGTTYIVEETDVPQGYVKHIDMEVTPSGEEYHHEMTVYNELLGPHDFSIWKIDPDGEPLGGAKFTIHKEGSSPDPAPISTVESGSDGKIYFEHLKPGTYFVREHEPPAGYKKSDTVLKAVIGMNGVETITKADGSPADTKAAGDGISPGIPVGGVVITDTLDPKYTFGFHKNDQFGNTLSGAVFGLYADPDCNDAVTGFRPSDGKPMIGPGAPITAMSAADGVVRFENIAFGLYYIQEVSPPTGGQDRYNKSDVVLEIVIAADGSYIVTDTADAANTASANKDAISGLIVKNELLGSLTVTKQDKFGTLSGVEFTLSDKGGNPIGSPVTTNANGIAFFDKLSLDGYTLTETGTLDGYTTHAPISVMVEYGNTLDEAKHHAEVTVTNERTRYADWSIDFLKQDPFGNRLEGAVFGILQVADGAELSSAGPNFTPEDTAVSGNDGEVEFTNLSFGRYYIREITAPGGYAKTDTVLRADIDLNGSVSLTKADGSDVTVSGGKTAVINNRAAAYAFSFDKIDLHTGNGLGGAVFSVAPTADSGGNTVALPQGTIDTATSDSQGKVQFTGLPFGAYLIKEVSAPQHYIQCEGSFKAEINIDGSVTFTVTGDENDPYITLNSGTVTVANAYDPPPAPPPGGGSGGSGGSKGGSGGGSNNRYDPPLPPVSPTPVPPNNLPPFFPQDTTVTPPVTVEDTDSYKITRQTISTPDGDDYDSVIITVKDPNGTVVGEIPPPPPREGYEFAGWYLDPQMKKPYRPGDPLPKGATRLYAKWYLSASEFDDLNDSNSHNPGTGDNALPYRPITAVAASAFIAIILSCLPLRKKRI